MKLKKLTINLMVESVERSEKFYSDVLGFTEAMSVPGDNGKIFSMIVRDDVSIMLQTMESFVKDNSSFSKMNIGGSVLLYIDVEKIGEVYERVKQNGVAIYKDMHETFYGTKEFSILDPDGYLVGFAEDQ